MYLDLSKEEMDRWSTGVDLAMDVIPVSSWFESWDQRIKFIDESKMYV